MMEWFFRTKRADLEKALKEKKVESPQPSLAPDLSYSSAEQTIIDRFERMPRHYRRIIERMKPHGWADLDSKMDEVERRYGKKP